MWHQCYLMLEKKIDIFFKKIYDVTNYEHKNHILNNPKNLDVSHKVYF